MGDGARVAAFVYAPAGVRDVPGTPFAVTWRPAPVVVLHGNGEDHAHMLDVIAPLARGRSIIAIDSRGQGASGRGSEPLAYELMAADALEVMSRLGVTQAHVLGFSDGGIVGLLLARDAASRVLSLTCLGANLEPEGLTRASRLGMQVALTGLAPVERVGRVVGDGLRSLRGGAAAGDVPADGAVASCRPFDDGPDAAPHPCEATGEPERYSETELLRLMLEQPHIEAASLAAVRCPACVMAGERDLIRPEETHRIAEALSGSRLVVVDGAGHDLPHDAPECVVAEAERTMTVGEQPIRDLPLVAWHGNAPQVTGVSGSVEVVPATAADEAGVLALYDRLMDSCEVPGRETCGWRRGFWPLPDEVSRRLRAGETWVAVSRDPAAPRRVLGVMSLDDDFGLPGVEPDWEPLRPREALTCHLLAVDPDERGQGVARALLARYADEAIRRGCRALRINTSPQSLSNRLYHELGFTLHKPVWFPYEGLALSSWTNVYELRLDGGDARQPRVPERSREAGGCA